MRFIFLALMLLTTALPARAQTGHSSADVTALFSNKTVRAGDQAVIDVVVTVNKGLHAQSHTPLDEYAIPLVVTPNKNDLAKFGDVEYPPALEKVFPNLGKLSVYEGKTVIQIPVTIDAWAKPGPLTFSGKVFFSGV